MATAEILPPNRSHISDLLLGDQLSTKFHELFDSKEELQDKKNDKKTPKKKPKPKNKDKKHKRDKSPEPTEVLLPTVELAGNPSLFNVYASVRQTVLEQCMKDAVNVYQQATNLHVSDTDTEEEPDDKNREALIRIPKIVGIGLNAVFELIRETCQTYPALCVKALQALLNLLQGQQPESMKAEPADVIDSMYHLLIDIAKGHTPNASHSDEGRSLTSLACAALLSLVIARGDTGKLLTAVAAMLMSPTGLSTQYIQVPYILTSLQKSIQAILLMRTQLPDWLTLGVREMSLRHTFKLHDIPADISTSCAVASDGDYLFIHNKAGLYKVGTGYGGTVKGHVYAVNSRFNPAAKGWLAFAAGKMYFKDLNSPNGELSIVCKESLEVTSTTELEGGVSNSNVLFSDGEHIGQVAAAKDDSFVVRTYTADGQHMAVSSEVPLKLARKCVDTFGSSPIDDQVDIHSISTGFDEDTSSVAAGKEFALIKTVSGKVLYSGKSQSLGIKQGGPSQGKWAELSITKSPKISQIAIGHEGQHALLVADDGGVFFAGTPKRGEDGDSSVLKARRQPKPLKPKKMIKIESKFIVQAACNNGTSSLVTKEGEVFMYGKDTSHCDHASGLVSDLKEVVVTQVALGKAHAVALTNKGLVYTYGINNKGQCGRDYTPGAGREANTIVNMVEEEEEIDAGDPLCSPGKHKWKWNQCMICFVCGECTGYGNRCINSGSSDRNPGMPCMCGAGDSGCSECGCCKTCSGEQVEDRELIDQSKDLNLLDLVLSGRPGAQQLDQLSKKLEQKKKTARVKAFLNQIRPSKSPRGNEPPEAEPEYSKLTSLPPCEIMLDNGDTPVTQIACGLHHSALLLQDGSVYTFGSNQYGQLGLGDTVIRGVPTRVSLPSPAVQLAAGSNHMVILLTNGQVLTCGNFQKGSLGRLGQEEPSNNLGAREKTATWFTVPGPVPGIGAKFGRRATWIGASGDQTFLRVDESLINAHTLAKSNVFANQAGIGLIPTNEDGGYTIRCLLINKMDGSCKSFNGPFQVDLATHATCLDPVYDVLWSYCPNSHEVSCYNVISSEAVDLKAIDKTFCDLFEPELAVPVRHGSRATRSHCALHILACLDTHTTAQQLNMVVYEEEREKQTTAKVFSKEDFLIVNRFESHGGGWGYSGHSIEAIRFMTDSDILLGGFGLFGGRGEYYGRIKIFDLGTDGGENETDGELLAETEEMPYECGAREKYAMLFDEPVSLQANTWYVAWARISGPSSDCGSSGQSTVTTEDQTSELSKFKVVFKFKSSKKSNNGTDVNAGQIPQILYRLPTHDSQNSVRKSDQTEPAHILSTDFSRAVSPTCFESSLMLLRWSWKTFSTAVVDVNDLKGIHKKAGISDLKRLVYISTATLRLLRIYITEVYPGGGSTVKAPTETVKLAECVGNTRDLLREILSEGPSQPMFRVFLSQPSASSEHLLLQEEILKECHRTFTTCFHAFCPTESLKWMCLCDLLNLMEPGMSNMDGYGRLLAAIMEAMCHPSVKLTNIFPINCEHETEEILRRQSVSIDDNTNSAARLGDVHQYPLLVSHMLYRTGTDSSTMAHCSFREILDRLLTIITLPIRQELQGESPIYPSLLVANTCSLLATIVSELSSSALGSETDTVTTTRPLLTTPNRFTRTSQSAYWNTGNGSPDAVAFMVDRPGVVIAGVSVYGGGGQYDYELELLDECESQGDASHSQRWNSLELVKGTYGVDSVNEVAEIKFDRPVTVKENVKYAIRLRNHGPRTLNGDGGLSKVKCPDGATFTFSACSLSINGTNHMRGQVPHILYYSAPQDGENHVQNNKALAEQQSRKNGISIASAICRTAKDILQRAQAHLDEDIGSIVGKSHLFSSLLPLVLAYIGPVAAQDPRGAVQVLSLVQDVLPAVAALNSQLTPQTTNPTVGPANANEASQSGDYTTSQHFAIVESDHSYKPATVANYKVSFPDSVKWVVLEFDPQCGTAQAEDSLQLYVPSIMRHQLVRSKPPPTDDNAELKPSHWPILKKFSGTHNWPKQSVILPGNEVIFSLETASDYVKDDKACFYGFKCFVVGYEWTFGNSEGIQHLEKELSYLGGMCASSLMRQDITLPPATLEEFDDDIEQTEAGAQLVFNAHSNLLSQGFALSHPPTIGQALEGNLPFCWQSNERAFLKDFVACTAGTSGGRLARWLQPDSYLDPKQCDILYNKDELKCSWPVVITVQTKDQYGQLVNVPNLKVDVKAVPIDQKDSGDDNKKMRRLSRPDDGDLTFGGHPPPQIDIPYEVTLKDKKDAFHAISMMKAYENYSFEELRYAAPSLPRPSENMLVRANNDGTYSANWTPGSIGLYNVYVSIDGFEAGDVYKVEVKEPPQGMTPPTMGNKKLHQTNRMRRFIGKHSAGLRIRSNPSLQSEQIGVIPPGGILGYIDEVHNADGSWLRLNPESLAKWCENGYSEGWALQYNQHLGKTLLVPVEEPKSIIDEIIKDAIQRKQPEVVRENKSKKGGPGVYHLVRCGSSGHNIRCGPSRKARPIGMLVLGNTVTAIQDLMNADGAWVKLDGETTEHYCHEVEGEAWSLARGPDEVVYLQHESELATTPDLPKGSPFSMNVFPGGAASPSQKGYDFTTAQRSPSFSVFGSSIEGPAFGHVGRSVSVPSNMFVFGAFGSFGTPGMAGNLPSVPSFGDLSGASGPTFSFSTPGSAGMSYHMAHKYSRGSEGSITPLHKSNHPKSPIRAATMGSYTPAQEKIFERKDIPPELQGVSVKELVKALGKLKVEREVNSSTAQSWDKPWEKQWPGSTPIVNGLSFPVENSHVPDATLMARNSISVSVGNSQISVTIPMGNSQGPGSFHAAADSLRPGSFSVGNSHEPRSFPFGNTHEPRSFPVANSHGVRVGPFPVQNSHEPGSFPVANSHGVRVGLFPVRNSHKPGSFFGVNSHRPLSFPVGNSHGPGPFSGGNSHGPGSAFPGGNSRTPCPRRLVELLGESRANANGPTPAPSPPGTPKKSLSRSSSPKAEIDLSKQMSPARPASPQRSDSPGRSMSQRSDSPCGSASSKSDSPGRISATHRPDSPGRGFHQRPESPCRGNAPPRPERTDKLVRPDRPDRPDRPVNANFTKHRQNHRPDRANNTNMLDHRPIMNNFERMERPDRPDANRVDRLDVNQIEMRVVHRVEKPDLPPRNFNMKAEKQDRQEWQANHYPRPESAEIMITNFIEPHGYDSPAVESPSVGRAKGRLTREMSFETPPATPPQSRKDISGEASPSSPRNISPARMSPARGASGGHTPVSARSQSPSAGSSHSSSGGDSTVRPAFNIGTSSPKEEPLRMSPKSGRKDRGRQLRTKRERAASPSPREITPMGRARSASLLIERGREPVKEALSPSVAECLRAVFAAFLWHEGIVHDAMACASFLKFNPHLSKEMSKFARVKSEEKDRVRIRHQTDSTHDRGKDTKKIDNINININESLVSLRSDQIRDNNEANDKATGRALASVSSSVSSNQSPVHRPRSAVKFQDMLLLEPLMDNKGLTGIDKESQLPTTLHHLVYFWEELSSAILKVINLDLIMPSPAVNVKIKKADKKEKDKDKEKKSKKRRDMKPMARGNLFGEAAGAIMFGHIGAGGAGAAGAAGGDRETMCELCGGMFPHPVTYHMRQSHPGCGRHACGKGYNSGGNFCGGWAGNCGEGGIGGSSWYLMCDKCRDKYLREKKQSQKEKDRNKKQKKKNLPKQTSMVATAEPHIVLKNNAMYLLELASAAGISLPVQSHKKRHGMPLPSVSEDGGTELNPFPPKQFEYLMLRGAESSDSAFAEEIFVDQEERVFVRSGSLSSGSPKRGGYRPRFPTESNAHGALSRASSLGQELKPVVHITPLSPQDIPKSNVVETGRPIPKSAGTSPDNEHDQGRRSIFQRSISELGETEVNEPITSNRVIMTRRRNNSGGVGDGGTSLLKYPSAAMSKLIGSVDKTPGSNGMGDKALQRPVLAFIIQRHDLDGLQLAMRQALRKSACRVYAMQALNWLIRTVTQPTCLHDLLWFFVSSLLPFGEDEEEEGDDNKDKKEKKDIEDKDIRVCEHPLADITLAGKAAHPLQPTFHTMLQTIADVMMLLPAGSSLQQMAVRCYCLKFQQSDHQFLHESHVFSNISRILTKSDEESDEALESYWMTGKVICLKDLTATAEVKASSRQAMVASLSDNSTETFWESGDEDRNKTKLITITCTQRTHPRMIYVHIDNSRDLGNKVSSVQFNAGISLDEIIKYRQVEIEARHIGWVSCHVPEKNCRYLMLELKGPDNNLRLRQVKVLGEQEGESLFLPIHKGALLMQQNNCEAETLKVFRLLTSQVFGKLLSSGFFDGEEKRGDNLEGPGIDNDLKEHMVGILFSRSKLSHLQKQVCAHIVQAIRKETERVKEEWESAYNNKNKTIEEENRVSDVYCFELLSMVLALSGSVVGRTHLAQQYGLLQDLFTLLHTGTPRVQRQVVSVLRRVLPEVLPEILATILKVDSLPPADFSIVTATSRDQGEEAFDPDKVGIIDVFLACIAKSLTVQTKIKTSGANKGVTSVSLAESLSELPSIKLNGARWWLRGNMSGTLATNIIQLLQDMAASQLSEPWAAITKAAIAEAILALTKLNETQRVPQTCIRTPTLWLALASLCVLDREHVDRLSSGQWISSQDGQHGQPRPTCDNHDDGTTAAIILCNDCGNLCADCDRFLHLHRKKRSHQRQVFKEEEEAIKVDLHEGCGRTKLFWVMALADSKTLKAMVEFREGKVTNTPGGPGTCRFCCTSSNTGLLAIGNVCADPDCQESARHACAKIHQCGHPCGGIKNEELCMPCLHRCRLEDQEQLKQDADDMCMICFTEALSAAPAIKLHCGHVFHCRCCQRVLEKRWVGPRITFGFSQCPICKSPINHSVLKELLDPIRQLYEDVRRKALMRLEYEGLHKAEAITTPGARFHSDPAGFAMDRYAYYVCFKCKKAYYGGEARCDEQAGGGDEYDPTELVCGACSDVSRAQMCPKHGTDFLEYKCRYCCSVAVFFCFGTTHFCNACHDDFQRVTNIPKHELPHCPAGPRGKQLEGDECPLHVQHPPTGEEFALGCGVCRNAHTF